MIPEVGYCQEFSGMYATHGFLDRFCVPDPEAAADKISAIIDDINSDELALYMADVYNCATAVLIVAGLSLVLGFVFMCLLRYIVGCMV
mmetsp:Transcript_20139/g.9331  ORF Transcript_20139/g.9331 Transcript_20139/m.9331 type:complete len:89 (-) Transcript_20139:88-354(-)